MTNNDFLPTDACYHHLFIVLGWDPELAQEAVECLCDLLWLIFVNRMTNLINNYKLELALHLSDRQLLIHPVTAG